MIATYVGFSSVSFMCMMWLLLPYHSPNMVWGLSGKGLRTTISLEGYYNQALAGILQINIGRLPYTSFVDRGMVVNDNVTGAQVVYGSKIKGALTVGRVNADPNGTKNSGGIFSMFGGGGTSQKTHYYGVEVFATPGKATFGAGFHRFGNRNFDDDGGIFSMFGGDSEKMAADIFAVGGGYQFDKIFGLNAAAAWNTKKDMGYDGSKRSWQVEATFGKEVM